MTPGLAEGLLDLRFARAADGKTVLVERRQRFPLGLTVPLYPDAQEPGMAFVYIQNPTGGVFGGDCLTTRVVAEAGALVHLTTQSATKAHRASVRPASQVIDIHVSQSGYVEYVPDLLIPFAGASLEQEVRVDVADDGAFFCMEAIAPGRFASGEAFSYERLALRTIASCNGCELFADTLLLEPGRRSPRRRGVLGRYAYVGTAVAVGRADRLDLLVGALDQIACASPDVLAAAGELPARSGVMLRVLAPTRTLIARTLEAAWYAARRQLIGSTPPPRRK